LALLLSFCFAEEQAIQQQFPQILTSNTWNPQFKPSYTCANYSFTMDSVSFFTFDQKSLGIRLGTQIINGGPSNEDLIMSPRNCSLSYSGTSGQLNCRSYVRIFGSCGVFVYARVDELQQVGANAYQVEVDADFRFNNCPRCQPQNFEVPAHSQATPPSYYTSTTGPTPTPTPTSYYTTGPSPPSYYPPPAYTTGPPPAYTTAGPSPPWFNPVPVPSFAPTPSFSTGSPQGYYVPPSTISTTGGYYGPTPQWAPPGNNPSPAPGYYGPTPQWAPAPGWASVMNLLKKDEEQN
jgi:hypothetical protein